MKLIYSQEDFDAVVGSKVKATVEDFEQARAAYEAQLRNAESALANERLDAAIRDSALEAGMLPRALPALRTIAKYTWRTDEFGQPVACDDDGRPLYGPTGEPLSITEWIESLKTDHDYLFTREND